MSETQPVAAWDEDSSRHFIDYGAYFVPEREVQIDTVCSVIPVPDGPAHIVEICCGEGLLAEALARRFPDATIHALDGSDTMLASTGAKLSALGVRHVTAKMEIAEKGWRRFDEPVHAFVSSLAVHHLDGPGKAQLFKDLAAALAPGGAVVICDLVEARNEEGRKLCRLASLFETRFEHYLRQSLLSNRNEDARQLFQLRMRLLRDYSGPWPLAHGVS